MLMALNNGDATLIQAWRARRDEIKARRLRASAEPARVVALEPAQQVEADDPAAVAATLNDMLVRWHRWQQGYSPIQTCSADPMFRNVKSSKNWDSTSQVIQDELHSSTMEAIEAQVSELPDIPKTQPYRSAIYAIARNLHVGASVWSNPRLPADPMERGVVVMEARNMLTRRLIAAGVM
jgi:hypothetical protein